MKTILFFDRCDLTRLYILLTKELQDKVEIIHVAFSDTEARFLDEAGLSYINYQNEFSHEVDTFSFSHELINEIDSFILKQSDGKFTLNGSIQSDRGYTLLNYDEALLTACCHYIVWKRIFEKHHVDIMYHEPASQFMTHIASLLCKEQGGRYIYQTQLESDMAGYHYLNIDGENFRCAELEANYSNFKEHIDEIDLERCKKFVSIYRKNHSIAFGNLVKQKTSTWELRLSSLKHRLYLLFHESRYDRIKNNIDYWIMHNNIAGDKLYNLKEYKYRGIKFEQPVKGDKYFYYSMHLEPEATVLYLSGGLYTNQIKLIENIAAALPPGYYLYVKDHPHEFAYRKADDYERLMCVPNIRLIDQRIPGKKLIRDAAGVFSINGTVGFEGLILLKNVFCFGESYYTPIPRVNYVKNVRDLHEIIYKSLTTVNEEDEDFFAFVYAYLVSMHDGFVTYFGDRSENAGINPIQNAQTIAQNIIQDVKKLQ